MKAARGSLERRITAFCTSGITVALGQSGWSIRKFVRIARRYRSVQIRAGQHLLTAEDPLPADLRDALAQIA
jgi:hypothetical protein